jgi:hypothetical protein
MATTPSIDTACRRDAVAFLIPNDFSLGEAANPMIKLAVGDAGHCAVVGLEDDRSLFGIAVLQIAIEAVVRHIELAVLEPFVERRIGFVERPGEGFMPQQLALGELGPEPG